MYLDFDDHRPETPRVPPVISVREGILLSLVAHLLLVIAILVAPASFFVTDATDVVVPPTPISEPLRYVHIAPAVERPAPPRPEAPASDLDRRAATVERPPDPIDPEAFSRGRSPERVVGAPEERMAGEESPVTAPPNPMPPAPPPNPDAVLIPGPEAALPNLAGGRLGDSLRNFQRYLDQETFNNDRGGQAQFGSDIQFDSRGIDFGPWLRRFKAQVESNWRIPMAAMVNRGRVVIQFDLYRNGRISNIRIVDASTVEGFNSAALNAIRMSNPTLPLPDEYPVEPVLFTVTFHYNDGVPSAP